MSLFAFDIIDHGFFCINLPSEHSISCNAHDKKNVIDFCSEIFLTVLKFSENEYVRDKIAKLLNGTSLELVRISCELFSCSYTEVLKRENIAFYALLRALDPSLTKEQICYLMEPRFYGLICDDLMRAIPIKKILSNIHEFYLTGVLVYDKNSRMRLTRKKGPLRPLLPMGASEEQMYNKFISKRKKFTSDVRKDEMLDIFEDYSRNRSFINLHEISFAVGRTAVEIWWNVCDMKIKREFKIDALRLYVKLCRCSFSGLDFYSEILNDNPFTHCVLASMKLFRKNSANPDLIDGRKLFALFVSLDVNVCEKILSDDWFCWFISIMVQKNRNMNIFVVVQMAEFFNYSLTSINLEEFVQKLKNNGHFLIRALCMGFCDMKFLTRVINNKCRNFECNLGFNAEGCLCLDYLWNTQIREKYYVEALLFGPGSINWRNFEFINPGVLVVCISAVDLAFSTTNILNSINLEILKARFFAIVLEVCCFQHEDITADKLLRMTKKYIMERDIIFRNQFLVIIEEYEEPYHVSKSNVEGRHIITIGIPSQKSYGLSQVPSCESYDLNQFFDSISSEPSVSDLLKNTFSENTILFIGTSTNTRDDSHDKLAIDK